MHAGPSFQPFASRQYLGQVWSKGLEKRPVHCEIHSGLSNSVPAPYPASLPLHFPLPVCLFPPATSGTCSKWHFWTLFPTESVYLISVNIRGKKTDVLLIICHIEFAVAASRFFPSEYVLGRGDLCGRWSLLFAMTDASEQKRVSLRKFH